MRAGFARWVLFLVAAGAGVGCGDPSESDGTARDRAPVKSAVRQRFDSSGVETLLVYKAGRVRGTGRFIAQAQPGGAPRIGPSPEVTLIIFRAIDVNLSERAAELGVETGHAYLVLGELKGAALDEEPLKSDFTFEAVREVDLAGTDEELAEAFGMKMETPPEGAENGLVFVPGDDVRLAFFLWFR